MPVPSWKTELKEVAPNVFAYIQGGGPGIDNHSVSNAGLINGDDSSMVIDALTAPVLTKAFIAAMKKVNPKPFRHLVNTHHHPDHVRGNCFFLPIEIIAHEKCREAVLEAGLTFPLREDWQEGIEELKLAPPPTTFADKLSAMSCAFIWSFKARHSLPSTRKKSAKRAKTTSQPKGRKRNGEISIWTATTRDIVGTTSLRSSSRLPFSS